MADSLEDQVVIKEILNDLIDGVEVFLGITGMENCGSVSPFAASQEDTTATNLEGEEGLKLDGQEQQSDFRQVTSETVDKGTSMTPDKSIMKSIGTSVSQEFIARSRPEMTDSDTSMSPEFISLQQKTEKCDVSTTSVDLVKVIDSSTWMDFDYDSLNLKSPKRCAQVVPSTISISLKRVDNGSENFDSSKRSKIEGISTSDDRLVPVSDIKDHSHDYLNILKERNIVAWSSTNSRKNEPVRVGTFNDQRYDYDEESINNENMPPPPSDNFRNFDEDLGIIENNSEDFDSLATVNTTFSRGPVPVCLTKTRKASGIHLRLGLSRRSKPTTTLHKILPRTESH